MMSQLLAILSAHRRRLAYALVAIIFALLLLLRGRILSSASSARRLGQFPPSPTTTAEGNDDGDDDTFNRGLRLEYESQPSELPGNLRARSRPPNLRAHPAAANGKPHGDPAVDQPETAPGAPSTADTLPSPAKLFRPTLPHLTDASLEEAHLGLVREYLAPWNGLNDRGVPPVRVTQRMLATMEYAYKGGAFRVRIRNNRLYYRKLVHWKQTYRTQRMLWYLRLLYEIMKRDKLLAPETQRRGVDFIIYVGDGAKVAADTFTTEAGFPLFSLRTSTLHIDIPIPDPVQHGSNGQYKWTEAGKRVPWDQRKPKLMFRGRGSCLKMQADNWHFCNRVRLQQLAKQYPEQMDAGIIQWNQIYKASKMVVPPTSPEEIERSTGLRAADPVDFDGQSHFRYIIDVDGGLGSSRKPGILSSGSLMMAAESPWYTYYEPLLTPGRHYISIDRWLRNLPQAVTWAQDHDEQARAVMEEGRKFEAKFLTMAASKKYMATLLNEYAKLMAAEVPDDEPVNVDYCLSMANREIEEGPMGCSQDWLLYNDHDIPPEIVSDKPSPSGAGAGRRRR